MGSAVDVAVHSRTVVSNRVRLPLTSPYGAETALYAVAVRLTAPWAVG
jgi:hypothetical protein